MKEAKKQTYLYVGTFTRPASYLEETNGEGLYVFKYDSEKGFLTYQGETHGIDSPSYLTFDRSGKFLYSNSEIFGWDEGLVKAYAIDQEDGSLSYLNMQPSRGSLTSYISVDYTNSLVLVTNYWTGSVVLFRIQEDGSLSQVIDKVQHNGSGPDPERQEGPHTHCVLMDPSNTFAYVTDLGLDKIFCYRLDKEKGQLILSGETKLKPGSGPRHFIFHPFGKYAYVVCELDSTVVAMAVDGNTGALDLIGSYETLPADFKGVSHCSDIQITPSGKFLYTGNRGHDSISIFRVDEKTGGLEPSGYAGTLGRTPRNFAIDPSGNFLLAANQDSDNIKTFKINQNDGQLEYTGFTIETPTPVCLKFLQI